MNARVTYKAVTDGYIADLKGVTGAYIPDGQSLLEVVSDSSRYVKAIYRLNPPTSTGSRALVVTIILPNMQTACWPGGDRDGRDRERRGDQHGHGDQRRVEGVPNRHVDPQGHPVDRADMAARRRRSPARRSRCCRS